MTTGQFTLESWNYYKIVVSHFFFKYGDFMIQSAKLINTSELYCHRNKLKNIRQLSTSTLTPYFVITLSQLYVIMVLFQGCHFR